MIVGEGSLNIGNLEIQFLINESGCWLCQKRHKDKDGYAQIHYNGLSTRVHRAVFQHINKIKLPPDLFVCHECDTPLCMNPDHLEQGTNDDNTKQKVSRGRQLKGEQINSSKLTEIMVIEILQSKNSTVNELARRYGVSVNCICAILKGKTWKHVYEKIKNNGSKDNSRMPNKSAIPNDKSRNSSQKLKKASL